MLKTILAALLALMLTASVAPIIAPSAMAADGVKYELNIKAVPTAALLARAPQARVLDFPAKKIEGHDAFASKDECEAHFEMADVPGLAMAMFQQERLKYGEDFTIEHECVTAGQEI